MAASSSQKNQIPQVELYSDGCGECLVKACEEVGIFKVSNHSFPMELVEKMNSHSTHFFSLTPQEKQIKHGFGDTFCYGNCNIGRCGDLGHLQYLLLDGNSLSPPSSSTSSKNQFDFRCVIWEYGEAMKKMAREILEAMADELGLEPRTTISRLLIDGASDCLIRVNEYSRCPEEEDSALGFGEHTDPQIISILTSNGVSGFQFKDREDNWLSLSSDPDAFFVIVGDSLQEKVVSLKRKEEYKGKR